MIAFQDFIEITIKTWNRYLNKIYNSKLELSNEGSLLYPNLALFVKTNKYYIMELFGSSSFFNDLSIKKHKELDINKYFYQLPAKSIKPLFFIGGTNNSFTNLTFSGPGSISDFKKRFPFLETSERISILQSPDAEGSLIHFKENFKNTFFSRCTFLNSFNNAYRAKYTNFMEVVSQSYNIKEYEADLEKRLYIPIFNRNLFTTDDLFGVEYAKNEIYQARLLSGQFASMFLTPEIRETTIGEFLEANPDIINKALGCKSSKYHPEMEWIQGNEKYPDEKIIIPDLMIERISGSFDIVDLKTVIKTRSSITKGPHKRRRFIDYVDEGIAQLSNYKEYFDHPQNSSHAYLKHNIKVNNPKMYLVVGSYDNVNTSEVEEACRPYRNNIIIIDYDTLNSLYLKNSISSKSL